MRASTMLLALLGLAAGVHAQSTGEPQRPAGLRSGPGLGLIVSVPRAGAQQAFADGDFGFTMALPEGLHEASPAERARIMSVTEDAAKNVLRSESDGRTPLTHHYFWVDRSSPYNRQMDVHLFDGPPPYLKPEDLSDAYAKTGLKVDATEQVKAPVGGLRIEGTFTNQQGVAMRKTVVYLPDRSKYAIVSLQCFAGDWAIVKPEFLQSILSIRLERKAPAGGPGATAQGGAAGKGKQHAGAGAHAEERAAAQLADTRPVDWKRLPILGSVVLSALLLGHLLLGNRSAR